MPSTWLKKAVSGAILGAETPVSTSAARLPWHSSQLSSCLSSSSSSPLLPLSPSDGLAAFRAFLRTEFSEENLEFWLACEEYKKIKSQSKMASKAKKIFAEYIAIQSCKEVSEECAHLVAAEGIWHQNMLSHTSSHFSWLVFCLLPPCRSIWIRTPEITLRTTCRMWRAPAST